MSENKDSKKTNTSSNSDTSKQDPNKNNKPNQNLSFTGRFTVFQQSVDKMNKPKK